MADCIELLTNSINNNSLSPIYLFKGEELFLINKAYGMIKNLIDKDFLDLDFSEFYPPMSIKDACEELYNCPFMSEKRVVVIRDYNKFTHDESELILKYAKKPTSTTILIILNSELKSSAKNITTYNFYQMRDYEVKKQAKLLCRELNVDITNNALELLIRYKCMSMIDVAQELKKLKAYCYPERLIDIDAVQAVVTEDVSGVIFSLTNAISHNDIKLAYRIAYSLGLETKEVLRSLIDYFQMLKFAVCCNLTKEELAAKTGRNIYYVQKTMEGAVSFSKNRVKKILSLLYSLEYSIRGGEISEESFLARALVGIMEGQ